MKLSEKILAHITEAQLNGYTWNWLADNTNFIEWLNDALELEKYIEAMKGESESE